MVVGDFCAVQEMGRGEVTFFIFQWEHKWPPAPGAETIPGPSKLDLSIMRGTGIDHMTIQNVPTVIVRGELFGFDFREVMALSSPVTYSCKSRKLSPLHALLSLFFRFTRQATIIMRP